MISTLWARQQLGGSLCSASSCSEEDAENTILKRATGRLLLPKGDQGSCLLVSCLSIDTCDRVMRAPRLWIYIRLYVRVRALRCSVSVCMWLVVLSINMSM